MQTQSTTPDGAASHVDGHVVRPHHREFYRDVALRNALRKRADGVPTYSVPEAAALLSISQEYLYRLIQADCFPAIRMRNGGKQGRYVVPAKAVEVILDRAAEDGNCVDIGELAANWRERTRGGAA